MKLMNLFVNSCVALLSSLLLTTMVVVASCILVMAEEFKNLPEYLQHASSMLVHNKLHRTIFICSLISLMAITSVIGVVACPSQAFNTAENPINQKNIQQNSNNAFITTDNHAGLDKLIFNFLEAAIENDGINDDNKRHNRSITRDTSDLQMKMSHVVDESSDKHYRRHSKRGFYRFYRYEKYYGSKRHRRKFLSNLKETFNTRKVLSVDDKNLNNTETLKLEEKTCLRPEYIVFTWLLCLIALASSLKLYYLVKTALASMIVVMYAVIILVGSRELFLNTDDNSNEYV